MLNRHSSAKVTRAMAALGMSVTAWRVSDDIHGGRERADPGGLILYQRETAAGSSRASWQVTPLLFAEHRWDFGDTDPLAEQRQRFTQPGGRRGVHAVILECRPSGLAWEWLCRPSGLDSRRCREAPRPQSSSLVSFGAAQRARCASWCRWVLVIGPAQRRCHHPPVFGQAAQPSRRSTWWQSMTKAKSSSPSWSRPTRSTSPRCDHTGALGRRLPRAACIIIIITTVSSQIACHLADR